MHALQRRVCSLMPRISYNDILACLICENYRCIPWFRGSCRRGKGSRKRMPATTFPQAQRPRGKHLHWLMRCKDSSTRTDVRASENRTYFRYYRHKQNTRRQNDRPSRAFAKGRIAFETAMRPWWLLGPTSPSNGFAEPAGRQAREFRTARITSTPPRSRRRAWGPRCPARWAACSKRWPRSSPGCRGARARARRAACRPRHARRAAA